MTTAYVDISSHQGNSDLAAYWADGHTDLMMKATEGTGYYWPQMQALAREWHAKGGRCGYYHWLYGNVSASAQADFFWSVVAPVWQAGDWLMTDFEDVDPARWVSDAAHLANVREFDRLMDQRGPVHDYAPNWYLAAMPLCTAYFKARNVVASDYSHNPPLNPNGFSIVAHQFTDRAVVAGFAGPVDYNVWLIQPAQPTPIGDDMSAADVTAIVTQLETYIDKRLATQRDAIVTLVLRDLTDTKNRIKAFEPEILGSGGLRKNIRDSFCALGGQLTTLPDGTSISSIGAIFKQLTAGIAGVTNRPVVVQQQPIDLAAISAAAQTGAAKGINGATIQGGQV